MRRCESPCKRNAKLIQSFLSCALDESTMVEYCRRTPLIRVIVCWKQCWGSGIFTPRSGIRDGKIRIRDKYPRSATLGCKFHADPAFLVNAVSNPVLDPDTGFWRPKMLKFYSRRNAFLSLGLQFGTRKRTYSTPKHEISSPFHVLWVIFTSWIRIQPTDINADPNSQHYHHPTLALAKKTSQVWTITYLFIGR